MDSVRSRALVVLAVAFACVGCDAKVRIDATTAPSPFAGAPFSGAPAPLFGASVLPTSVPIVPLPGIGCPVTPPFTSSFTLALGGGGRDDLFLHEIGFRFVDHWGLVSPLLYSQADLSEMFVTTLVPAGASRQLPFSPRFGCGLASPPQTLAIRVVVRDRRGGVHEGTVSAAVQQLR